MTAKAELLAALVEERFPAAAIEAERYAVRRPAAVRLAAPAPARSVPADSLPAVRQRQLDLLAVPEPEAVETIHAADSARRAGLAEEANRRAAAISHLRAQRAERRTA